jgi:hypothetical protein
MDMDYNGCEICGAIVMRGNDCPVCALKAQQLADRDHIVALENKQAALNCYAGKPVDWSPLDSERQPLTARLDAMAGRLVALEAKEGPYTAAWVKYVSGKILALESALALLGQPAAEVQTGASTRRPKGYRHLPDCEFNTHPNSAHPCNCGHKEPAPTPPAPEVRTGANTNTGPITGEFRLVCNVCMEPATMRTVTGYCDAHRHVAHAPTPPALDVVAFLREYTDWQMERYNHKPEWGREELEVFLAARKEKP